MLGSILVGLVGAIAVAITAVTVPLATLWSMNTLTAAELPYRWDTMVAIWVVLLITNFIVTPSVHVTQYEVIAPKPEHDWAIKDNKD